MASELITKSPPFAHHHATASHSSMAARWHFCPHKCGCKYKSKDTIGIDQHCANTRHPDCTAECPHYDPPTPENTQVEVTKSTAAKQKGGKSRSTVQAQERPTTQKSTDTDPKLRLLDQPRRVESHESSPLAGIPDSDNDDAVFGKPGPSLKVPTTESNDTDAPPPLRSLPTNPLGRGRMGLPSQNPLMKNSGTNHSGGPCTKGVNKSVFEPRGSMVKRSLNSSKPVLNPTQCHSAELVSSSPKPGSHHSGALKQPSSSQPAPSDEFSTPTDKTSSSSEKTTPPEAAQRGAANPVDATDHLNPDAVTTAKDPTPSQVEEPDPDRNSSPAQGSPTRSTPNAPETDIESLYASPSPEKMKTELLPIELDSDPDFEMMERMLFSHRGSASQSQSIKKEPTVLSIPSRTKGHLKRQRSHPSLPGPSQLPAQANQIDPRPTKRSRINGPRSSDSAVVLNDRRKHPEFWDLDGTVILQVDDTLFRVMRSTLGKASPWFRRLFDEEFDHLEIIAGCLVYVIEEDLSHLDFANLLRGLENGLEYALDPPHYLRILSIFRAASLLEFDTLRRWSLGCLEKQWPANLPPPSKPSKFGGGIPWAEETLAIADKLDVPQLMKRAYWELCTRSEFGKIDVEVYDDEVGEIMVTRPRLLRSVLMDLTRLRERLFPEWTRITRTPPIDVPCARAMKTPSTSTSAAQPIPCSLNYGKWHKIISEVEVNDMTIDDRRTDPISALEVMVVGIDWMKEGGFCADCVGTWKKIWTNDREKIWKNLGDWLGLDVAAGS